MITPIGERAAGLYFIADTAGSSEPYYFKEDLIVPDTDPKDTDRGEDEVLHRRDSMIHSAMHGALIRPGAHFSSRIIATSRLSVLLGIDGFVAQAERASATIEGTIRFGTGMQPVGGARYKDMDALPQLKGYRTHYTAEAVRQLTILTIFDFVCGQIDRHSKNIKLYTDIDLGNIEPISDGEDRSIAIEGVCAIDHDLSFGELTYDAIKKQVSRGKCFCPELFGKMQYPAVDMEFCEKLFSLKEDSFRADFSDLLTDGEVAAFYDRLAGLEQAVRREQQGPTEGFPRLITDVAMYEEYLQHMEENAQSENPDADMRFNCRPTYLKSDILRHKPLSGGEV